MRKRVSIGLLLSLFSVLFLTSCYSSGNRFDYNSINNLKPGDSEQEVIEVLEGKPCTRTSNDNGTYDLEWKYMHGNKFHAEGFIAIIRFSQDGKMLKIVKQGTSEGPWTNRSPL